MLRFILPVALAMLVGGCTVPISYYDRQIDYSDAEEVIEELTSLADANPNVALYTLGPSSDPAAPELLAVKIGVAPEIEDDAARKAIMFECGMHANEWYARETCIWLIRALANTAQKQPVSELLSQADVWVLPNTNPGGRSYADRNSGDPTKTENICIAGTQAGQSCVLDADCNAAAGVNACRAGGRMNRGTGVCPSGVNLARNFSVGWNGAGNVCPGGNAQNFRGPAPFSEPESLAIRRFVHNHMIALAVIVHGNGQWLGYSLNTAPTQALHNRLLALRNAILNGGAGGCTPPGCNLQFADNRLTGGGVGQFSAWLTALSNTPAQPDTGTIRGIPTHFVEVPVGAAGNYGTQLYDGLPLQFSPNDGSSGVRPSGRIMQKIYQDSIKPLYLKLIRQTRSPQCPLDATGAPIAGACYDRNYTIAGAKIASSASLPGALTFDTPSREERLAPGEYDLVWVLQNASALPITGTVPGIVVESSVNGGATTTLSDTQLPLSQGERRVCTMRCTFEPGQCYGVTLQTYGESIGTQAILDSCKIWRFKTEPAPATCPAAASAPLSCDAVPSCL